MAVYSYGSTNINFSTFDVWSTEYSSNSNISLDTVMGAFEPADTAPHSVSELQNESILYGTVTVNGTGTVAVTAPYTIAANSSSITLKNSLFSVHPTITVTATAVYPNYLEGFYTGPNGTGTLLVDYNEPATTGTLSLTSTAYTSTVNFYAYFVNAHV